MKKVFVTLNLLGWLVLTAHTQLSYTVTNGVAIITGYKTAAGLNVVIPARTNHYPVTTIGAGAFLNLAITNVTIPNSVIIIASGAFEDCFGLTNVEIPNSVTNIGRGAFEACSGLTSVTIPNSVTSIGTYAFEECSGLKSVTVGSGVTNMDYTTFFACSGLTNIAINAGNPDYTSMGGVLFDKGLATLITCPNGLAGSYDIPNSVTFIGTNAFEECSSLTSVTIGNSVTNIGAETFENCYSLTSVTIGNSVINIGDQAFENCYSLTSVTIPNSVRTIGAETFYECYSLTSVTIPNSVISIGYGVFESCSGLTSVTIPNSVTTISDEAFGGCGLTSVTIPNSVTTIGNEAFEDCSGLTSVTIPNSVANIGEEGFFNCGGLTSVTIGNSVTNIGDDAFFNCRGLTSVTIPNSMISIGLDAFEYCSLTEAYFQGNAPLVNGSAGSNDHTVFFGEAGTVFYPPNATGWGTTFGNWPTAVGMYQSQPQIRGAGQGFVLNNGFGFTTFWATNASVVVQVSTNLVNWTPIITNALVSGTNVFTDSNWKNYPQRFYRVQLP